MGQEATPIIIVQYIPFRNKFQSAHIRTHGHMYIHACTCQLQGK